MYRTKCGADEDRKWIFVDKKVTKTGQGPYVVKKWTVSGQKVENKWTEDRIWTESGRPTSVTSTELFVHTS